MQTIGLLIQKSKEQTITLCNNTSTTVSQGNKAWLTRWKSHSDIERQFSPNNWAYTLANAAKAYKADCPTLYDYEKLYGEGVSGEWVRLQMLALYGSSNCKDIGVADGIKLFSYNFAYEVRNYKISELMLFFARYKAGKYDNSYSSFDSKRVGNAFFYEFLKERNFELEKIHREDTQLAIEKRRFVPPEGYSSLSWYNELKKRASQGDFEALMMVNSKIS